MEWPYTKGMTADDRKGPGFGLSAIFCVVMAKTIHKTVIIKLKLKPFFILLYRVFHCEPSEIIVDTLCTDRISYECKMSKAFSDISYTKVQG